MFISCLATKITALQIFTLYDETEDSWLIQFRNFTCQSPEFISQRKPHLSTKIQQRSIIFTMFDEIKDSWLIEFFLLHAINLYPLLITADGKHVL
jgi:hypothetical protein